MNNLMIFEGNEVEVFEYEGKILFNPKHVGKCLELSDSARLKCISRMNEKQVIKLTNSNVTNCLNRKLHNTGENFLTESGVYKMIFASRSEGAERFQDWVTDEVLPSIRKHGAYMTENALEQAIANPDFMIGLLTKLKEEQEENKKLKLKIDNDKPLVDFATTISSSSDSIDVGTFAKLVKDEGINMGRNRLFDWLRSNRYLMKDNVPYQKYIDNKFFEVIEYSFNTPYGEKLKTKTLVTGLGQIKLVEKLRNEQINNK